MESEVEVKTLENHVFEALGHASVCWSEPPKGHFDSVEATKAGETLMKHINSDVPYACGIVFKALREDPEYYQAWQANIAMAFKDCMYNEGGVTFINEREVEKYEVTPENLHQIANNAAKYFLNLLIKPIEK